MLIFQVSKSTRIPGYLWINYPLSKYPWYLTIHVSNYPSIHDINYPWYPTIQVSMIFKYPWYPTIRISEKSGIHSSLVRRKAGKWSGLEEKFMLASIVNVSVTFSTGLFSENLSAGQKAEFCCRICNFRPKSSFPCTEFCKYQVLSLKWPKCQIYMKSRSILLENA